MGAMAEHLKRSWIDRLRFGRLASPSAAEPQTADAGGDPLLLAGERLRQAREQRGLGLRQLAAETLVSTAVIEALERGWRDRLPEPAYLRTILPLLERYLALEPGSLAVALPGGHTPSGSGRQSQARLPLLSVQLFTTWQGTAAYGALMLALLYGLNLEQRRLAARGVHALNPVPPLSEVSRRQLPPRGTALLLQTYPELRPLDLARQPRGLVLVRRQQGQARAAAEPGVLELSVTRPHRLTLESAGLLRSELQVAAGLLVLPLTPPLQLRLDPPEAAGVQVRWNGLPLEPAAPGRYRLPRAASSP